MDNIAPVVQDEPITIDNPRLLSLTEHKKEAYEWQKRRHTDWTDNYTLYRDTVIVNRLLQRQSVNVPLMKTVLQTTLHEADDPPLLEYENLDNDKQKELFFNEFWKDFATQNKLTIKDIVDKKQEFLYGRTFKKINLVDGKVVVDIIDPQDILITRYADPVMLNKARYLCHQHIFVPLSTLEHNPEFDKEGIYRLKVFYATERGLIKAEDNAKSLRDRNQRMQRLGVVGINEQIIGETYVELNEHYIIQWNEDIEEEEYYLKVTCDDMEVLSEKRLEAVIGETKDHYFRYNNPFNSWADDIDATDIWSDGKGDVVRTPNKVANSWVSQMIENRTLRNFSMYFFDSTVEGYQPQTYDPRPFGFYPAPGNPQQSLYQVQIPDLGDSENEINFVINLAKGATSTPDMTQGLVNKKTMTKAEQMNILAEAKEGLKSNSIYYNEAWREFGILFIKFCEANEDRIMEIKVFKKGYRGTVFGKKISPNDWHTKSGYTVNVLTKDEKDKKEQNDLGKLINISQDFQNNQTFQTIKKKKELAYAGLNPDEVKQVLDEEKQHLQAQIQMQQQQNGQQPGQQAGAGQPLIPGQMQLPAQAGQ